MLDESRIVSSYMFLLYSQEHIMRLKEIKNLNQLSKLLEIDRNTLNSLLNSEYREKLYKVYSIPKKDGSERQICAPQEPLKSIQKRISELL